MLGKWLETYKRDPNEAVMLFRDVLSQREYTPNQLERLLANMTPALQDAEQGLLPGMGALQRGGVMTAMRQAMDAIAAQERAKRRLNSFLNEIRDKKKKGEAVPESWEKALADINKELAAVDQRIDDIRMRLGQEVKKPMAPAAETKPTEGLEPLPFVPPREQMAMVADPGPTWAAIAGRMERRLSDHVRDSALKGAGRLGKKVVLQDGMTQSAATSDRGVREVVLTAATRGGSVRIAQGMVPGTVQVIVERLPEKELAGLLGVVRRSLKARATVARSAAPGEVVIDVRLPATDLRPEDPLRKARYAPAPTPAREDAEQPRIMDPGKKSASADRRKGRPAMKDKSKPAETTPAGGAPPRPVPKALPKRRHARAETAARKPEEHKPPATPPAPPAPQAPERRGIAWPFAPFFE